MVLESIHANAIIREIKTDGHSPLLIIGSDYEMYVAKNDKGKIPPFSLINECLAFYLLNCFNIKTPECKIVKVSKELIAFKQDLTSNHKRFYYDTPCFGSKFIKNAIDVNDFILTHKKKVYNKLINPLDVFRITLFDTWVDAMVATSADQQQYQDTIDKTVAKIDKKLRPFKTTGGFDYAKAIRSGA